MYDFKRDIIVLKLDTLTRFVRTIVAHHTTKTAEIKKDDTT